MPDFRVLSEQLRVDLSRVDWSPADDIRAAGTRRRRTQLLGIGAAAAAVVAVVASVALLVPNGRPASAPFGGPSQSSASSPTFDPSAIPSDFTEPPPGPTFQPDETLPGSYLLRPADLAGGFTGTGEPFAGLYSANPLDVCHQSGLPGPQPTGAIAEMLNQGQGNSATQGGETVLSYGTTADADAVLDGIRREFRVPGPCTPYFTAFLNGVDGEVGVLFYRDPAAAVPQEAHGAGVYQVIVRRGGYLVWITVESQTGTTDLTGVAITLAQRAGTRLCSQARC